MYCILKLTSCATRSGIIPQKERYNCKSSAECFITSIGIRSSKFPFWKKKHAIRPSKRKKSNLSCKIFDKIRAGGRIFLLFIWPCEQSPCVTIYKELCSRESYQCSARSVHSSCPVIMEGQKRCCTVNQLVHVWRLCKPPSGQEPVLKEKC